MFGFKKQKPKPPIKFFNVVPGVSTLYPITKSSELTRDWVQYEKQDYQERISRCPIKRFQGGQQADSNMPRELANLFEFAQIDERNNNRQDTSVGKCPAINAMMHCGYIVYAPADFLVYAENQNDMKVHHDSSFPPAKDIITAKDYVELHGPPQAKWLKDSTKDSTNDNIIKVNTMWSVLADNDIAFIQMKVPYVKETRFSAVTGILDPIF